MDRTVRDYRGARPVDLENLPPTDEIDRRALNGELIIEPIQADWGKGLVVALPMKSSQNYRGTNCVSCHMAPEGEVLGAIRLEYNLSHVNSMISQRTFIAVSIMATLGLIGFLVTLLLIRKFIVRPIQQTSSYMQSVSESKDLSQRLEHNNKDEIGQLAIAINSFMGTVSDSLQQVQNTSHDLTHSAAQLTNVAMVTDQAAHNQQKETSDVQTNIEQMQSQQLQVEQATEDASGLIKHTTSVAEQSAGQAHNASSEIKNLVTDIELVKGNIVDLNQQTAEVSTILADEGRSYFFKAINSDQVRLKSSETIQNYQALSQSEVASLKVDSMSPALAYMGIGVLEDVDGKHQIAQEYFKKSLTIDKSSVKALLNMGYSHYMYGNYKEAYQYTRSALELEPNNEKALKENHRVGRWERH